MIRFPFIAQRLFNVPLAIHPRKAEVVVGALAERLGVANLTRFTDAAAFADDDDFSQPARGEDRGYDNVSGIAVIPIRGTLVQKTGACRPYSGMTGYDSIRAAFCRAIEDESIKAIVLDIDSPGGEIAGLFDLCDMIAATKTKTTWAILDECAYSAAYALASCADHITVPRTGGTGSVGVICVHTDFSKALSGAGIKVTFIQSGALKSDGASEKPLSDDALGRFQADIDAMAAMFFDLVARNRKSTPDAIKDLEAGTYLGVAGTPLLADEVLSPDAAFRKLAAQAA